MPATSYSYNPALTSYAKLIAPDLMGTGAEFIAPSVQVPATLGHYKAYNDKTAFQNYDTRRGVGGKAKRMLVDSTDPTYNCEANALEYAIDDIQRAQSGVGDPLGQEKAGIQALLSNSAISHEKNVFDTIAAGTSAVGGVGVWSNNSNSPIKELNAQIEALATLTGRMPNRILFGLTAFRIYTGNSNILSYFPGAPAITVGSMTSKGLLINPELEFKVAHMPYDSTKMGKSTATKTQIAGSEVYIFFASPAPNLLDPSFAKTFRGGEGGVTQVRQYRDEEIRSDVYAVDWSTDIQITSSISVKRITVS